MRIIRKKNPLVKEKWLWYAHLTQLMIEITLLDKNSLSPIKIRGKKTALVVNPTVKTSADAVLLLGAEESFSPEKVENQRLVIEGPGEYEISGVKITSFGRGRDLAYEILLDGVDIFLGTSKTIEKVHDAKRECEVLILRADSVVDQSFITALSPKIIVFCGEQAQASAKIFGKNEVLPTQKIQIKSEKLPEEMEVIVLT